MIYTAPIICLLTWRQSPGHSALMDASLTCTRTDSLSGSGVDGLSDIPWLYAGPIVGELPWTSLTVMQIATSTVMYQATILLLGYTAAAQALH